MMMAYLKNWLPHKALVGKTAYEVWFGQKSDLSNLREISARVFVLNVDPLRVFNRSRECVMIGYSPNSKTYRLYDHVIR